MFIFFCKASLDKVANRKAQLMKWKEQKELRKKVEELEKAKKKPFRVVHVEPVAFPVKNLSSKLQHVGNCSIASLWLVWGSWPLSPTLYSNNIKASL